MPIVRMMKKFKVDCIGNHNKAKASVQRSIRANLAEQFPKLEPYLDDLMPKKAGVTIVKCTNNIKLIVVDKDILFFNERDGIYIPTLRLVHKYPFITATVQVDLGAIKHVLGGSNIMCPGLTSPGGRLDDDFARNTVVIVNAEAKERALAVGIATMSRDEIRDVNKNICIVVGTTLNDGLWHMPVIE